MAPPFDFSSAIVTIRVATIRILPDLLQKLSVENVYDTTVALNPVVSFCWLALFLAILQIVLSIFTRSFAWNDRFWPFIPLLYALLFATHPIISQDNRTSASYDLRLSIMAFIIFLWAIRLAYNAFRRGYYSYGSLDYRYPWLRENIITNTCMFVLVYAFACCGFMTFLLSTISFPLYFAWLSRGLSPNFTFIDVIATAGMLGCILLEAIADNQQYHFQVMKAAWLQPATSSQTDQPTPASIQPLLPDMRDGFLQSGLFSYCRHPNYFAEISFWWFFYLFSISTSSLYFNWTIVGPLLYSLMFQFSTSLTECISSEKYPAYHKYQENVSRLIPSPLSRLSGQHGKSTKKDD